MKKVFLFLAFTTFATLGFVSCSGDDDNNSSDPIVGTWYDFSDSIEGEYEDCYKKSTTTFQSDGTMNHVSYEPNEKGECAKNELGSFSATWKNEGNNKYAFTELGKSDTNTGVIVFSDNNNTITTTYSDGFVKVYKRK